MKKFEEEKGPRAWKKDGKKRVREKLEQSVERGRKMKYIPL